MAISVITPCKPAINAVATVTKDALDGTDGHSIDVDGISSEQLTVFIEMDTTVAHTIAFKAGDFEDAVKGDLSVALAAVGTTAVTIETARFKDEDSLILIDVTSTGVSGNIYASVIPA